MHTRASVFLEHILSVFYQKTFGEFSDFFTSVNSTNFLFSQEKKSKFQYKKSEKKIPWSEHLFTWNKRKKKKKRKKKEEFVKAAQKSRSQNGLDPVGT
jgi:hypothetical protein